MRAGIYTRISVDKDGTSTATARQLEDCRKLAEARGWEVAEVFEDSDVSAYKRRVVRPEFERMILAVKAREVDVVLCWKVDRMFRRLRDFAALDEACESAGARIVSVVDGIDTGTSAGRVVASVMTAMARAESENISIRGARKHRELAKNGEPSKGGTRAYGYTRGRGALIEHEAQVIREAANRVFAGESVRGICRDLGHRGVVSSAGKAWQPGPLRRVLTSAHIAGLRDLGGEITDGKWPAIISPTESQRLQAVLLDPGRRMMTTNARSYLLAGFVRCGICGEGLISRPRQDGRRRYCCVKRPGSPACGKLARVADAVEETVLEALCIALEGVDLRNYKADKDEGDGLAENVREDERALVELAEDYANKRFTRAEFFAARDVIEGRLKVGRNKLAKSTGKTVLAGLSGGEALRKSWPTATLEWRRAVVSAIIDHIVIEPSGKGTRFNPALVRITWRA